MGESFYTVLGVGTDADADAIERAYRDRVKECHPDVSDTPDARDRFKRLTVARDTLVDGDERFRYDTLGHERYVREHVTSGLFDVESPSGGGTGTQSTDESATEAAASDAEPSGEDERTGDTEQTDAGGASVGGFADAAAAAEQVATDGGAREWAANAAASGSSTATATGSRSHGTPSGGSDIYGTRSSTRTVDGGWPAPLSALAEALGTLGPWLVVYLLVAATAGATGWVVVGTTAVSPFVAACLGVIVCIALVATLLHAVANLA